MLKKIHFTDVDDAFTFEHRGKYNGKFSRDGLRAMCNHFEELEKSTGQQIIFGEDLDVVSISSDYAEYTIDEIWENFPNVEEFSEIEKYTPIIEVRKDNSWFACDHTYIINISKVRDMLKK